jgi:hypothetical protein
MTGIAIGIAAPFTSCPVPRLRSRSGRIGTWDDDRHLIIRIMRKVISTARNDDMADRIGSPRGADAFSGFGNLFLFLALAGLLTSLLSVAIDTRPAEVSSNQVA